MFSVFKNTHLDSNLSIRIGSFRGIKAGNLYGYTTNIGLNERGICHGLISSEQLNFVTSSTSFAIASSDNTDNHVISIEYYADTTSESIATQTVTLNGQTKVTITTNMFRIMKLTNTSSTNPAGTLYIGLNSATFTTGKPPDIYSVMVGESGQSRMAIMYCPPNKELYIVSMVYQSDIDNTGDIHMVKYKSHLNTNPNAEFVTYYPFSHGCSIIEKLYSDPISALTTVQITSERTAGTGNHDAVIHISYAIVNLPHE